MDLEKREPIDRADLGRISPTRGSLSRDDDHAIWPGTEGSLILYRLAAPAPTAPVARATAPATTGRTGTAPPDTVK